MKRYDHNSSKNQTIKMQFVQREVYACISDFAEYLFSYDGDKYADWDEWENLYIAHCPECGEVVKDWNEVTEDDVEYLQSDTIANEYMDHGVKCPHCDEIFEEEPEAEPQDIYEYWIVSSWLGEKLREKGEPVLARGGGWIWGRTCTGQAILLDHVISETCYDMEILEGQAREWKV
jgi:uncharacterized C2H2 Zn-finger protein